MSDRPDDTHAKVYDAASAPEGRIDNGKAQAYWRANMTLILTMLAIWALVSLVCGIILAVPLYDIKLGSLPLSFWFAQQGSIIIFVLLILVYALLMDRMDNKYDVHE